MMDPLDEQLRRLLHAAHPDSDTPEETPPFGFSSRVLAEWRVAKHPGPWHGFTPLCRQAVLWSCALAALTLALSFSDLKAMRGLADWQSAELRLANSAVHLGIP